jgi:hypothetical protein
LDAHSNSLIFSNTRTLFVTFTITLITILVIDTSLSKVSDLLGKQSYVGWSAAVYLLLTGAFAAAQLFLLRFTKKKIMELGINKAPHLKLLHSIVTLTQYILIAVIFFLNYELIVTSHYNTVILAIITTISHVLALFVLTVLSYRLILWSMSDKSKAIVLLYAISSMGLATNVIFSLPYMDVSLINRPPIVSANSINNFIPVVGGSTNSFLSNGYVISDIVSFIAIWISSLFLLHRFSKRIGATKFWIIVASPLAYFLSQFVAVFFNILSVLMGTVDPLLFNILITLVFTSTKLAGGVLFGVAFWTVARTIRKDSHVRDYMIISAYGVILFFVSEVSGLIQAPFPPFGVLAMTIEGFASYMLFLGIYSSAISVTQDSVLRRSIRKSVETQSNLLQGIGAAEMQKEMERTVLKTTKENAEKMKEDTGVEKAMTDVEMKDYMNQVVNELTLVRKRQKQGE